jgi:hypothetical protein
MPLLRDFLLLEYKGGPMKFINSTLVVGIVLFAAVVNAEAPKYNCVEANNKIFDRHGFPEFGEYDQNMHDQSQGVDLTSNIPYTGHGYYDDGSGYHISYSPTKGTITVNVRQTIYDPNKSPLVATVYPRSFFHRHKDGPLKVKVPKQKTETRADLYKYSFNIVGQECQLNQVEIVSNVGKEEAPLNPTLVTSDVCQSASQPDSTADIKVKSVCSWFRFYPQTTTDAQVIWGVGFNQ